MTHNQKVYALKRIDELKKEKESEARKKFTVESRYISLEEKYKLVKSGKVKLLPLSQFKNYTDFVDAYDFSAYENEGYLKEEYKTVMEKVTSMSTKAKDQIMLGDCGEALKLIQELSDLKI